MNNLIRRVILKYHRVSYAGGSEWKKLSWIIRNRFIFLNFLSKYTSKLLINSWYIISFLKDFSKCGENIDPYRIHQSRSVGLWPWMASLGFWSDEKWNHKCGATLIDQTRIITAGHCIENKKEMKKRLNQRFSNSQHF